MPYHARITPTKGSSDEVKLDISEEDLHQRILDPFRAGRPMVVQGRTFQPDDIKRLRISFTDQTSDELRPRIEAERERADRESSVVFIGGPSLDWYIAASGRDVTDELITGPPGSASPEAREKAELPQDPRTVMVVHGRDAACREAMFQFLESLDLHPLDWSELRAMTGKTAPYVGEILHEAFTRAQAFVVLLTGDDEARLRSGLHQPGDPPHETELSPQARPNVLFEAGMAMSRHPNRTILVEVGNLRPFSDIGGVHLVRMSDSTRDRQELALRLRDAGCPVNLTSTRWHSAGSFD